MKISKDSIFRYFWKVVIISADLVLQIERVQTFFLRKYLILLRFLILKTPIEDSILCHKPDFIHHFLTRRAFACLLIILKFLWNRLDFESRIWISLFDVREWIFLFSDLLELLGKDSLESMIRWEFSSNIFLSNSQFSRT